MKPISIRLSQPNDRDAILEFVTAMGFNARDKVTWDALHMYAVTAWDETRLVGAIPMEPRNLQIAPGFVVPSIHQTVVAVRPDFRGMGIGSRMQALLDTNQPNGAAIATVFRNDENSGAYRWYRRNGFSPAMHIDSWLTTHPKNISSKEDILFLNPSKDCIEWNAIEVLWRQTCGATTGGFVDRADRPLQYWLPVHPYRKRYDFALIVRRDEDCDLCAYALIGTGTLRSKTERLDILEFCATENQAELLLHDVAAYAARKGLSPLRWPLADQDPNRMIAKQTGLKPGWDFDMLVRPLRPRDIRVPIPQAGRSSIWRYHSIDFI